MTTLKVARAYGANVPIASQLPSGLAEAEALLVLPSLEEAVMQILTQVSRQGSKLDGHILASYRVLRELADQIQDEIGRIDVALDVVKNYLLE